MKDDLKEWKKRIRAGLKKKFNNLSPADFENLYAKTFKAFKNKLNKPLKTKKEMFIEMAQFLYCRTENNFTYNLKTIEDYYEQNKERLNKLLPDEVLYDPKIHGLWITDAREKRPMADK